MKKTFLKITSFAISATFLFSVIGCEKKQNESQPHVHDFSCKVAEEKYLDTEESCLQSAKYYFSCVCGEKGKETFNYGVASGHNSNGEVVADAYLQTPATCISPAVYYASCSTCGKIRKNRTFIYGANSDVHDYSKEVVGVEYLKAEATFQSAEEFYKSCKLCGEKGTETFFYGEPLKEYTQEERNARMPISLCVSLYDSENSIYGFTYNTESKPLRPEIQICEGNSLRSSYKEYYGTVQKETTLTASGTAIEYYIVKAEVKLETNTIYSYRAYDKYAEVGSQVATIKTKDTQTTQFAFAHVSDSQKSANNNTGIGSGDYFGQVLSNIVDRNDLIVHTGDIVQDAQYEGYWTSALNDNFAYLSKIPVMAISGNHEGGSENGNETFKHFHYKIPQQTTTLGLYYSFTYGNTKFIMLNTNNFDTAQLNWVKAELTNNTSTWTIVAMHCPMYSVGSWGANPERYWQSLNLRSQLQGIFAENGVDIVLQGHDHTVSRTYPINKNGQPQTENYQTENGVEYSVNPSGVIYVMNGPAGNQTRSPYEIDTNLYKYGVSSQERSWADFTIDGDTMKVSVKYYDGTEVKTYYTWGIKKTMA